MQELNEAERTALAERMDMLAYQPGQNIFEYGDPGHALYIIRSGEVEIYVKNDQGEKIVLEVAKAGDVFGEVSLLDNGTRTAWVTAVDEVDVLRLDREHFEDYVKQYTPAALNLLSIIARRLRKSDELIRRTATRNANDVSDEQTTALVRIAEWIPAITGSVPSVILHIMFFAAWIIANEILIAQAKAFDPYPFEFMAVIVSLEAIFLTLLVLTSQNRQRVRDRIRSDIEFESAINTEMKIAYLHEKIDRLTESHYEILTNTQKLLGQRRPPPAQGS